MTVNDEYDRRPVHRALMWLGHYYPRVSPVLYLSILAAAVVGLWVSPTPPAVFLNLRVAATTVLLVMMTSRDFIHNRNLCLRDLNEAPLLDPQAAVEKHIGRLRRYHFHSWPVSIAMLVGLIGGGLILGSAGVAYTWPWIVRAAITAVVTASTVMAVRFDRARVTHDRLQPWCPICRRRRGDDGDHVKPPTPTPSGTAT